MNDSKAMELRYTASRADVRALLFHNLRHANRLRITLLTLAALPVVLGALSLSGKHALTSANLLPYVVAGVAAATLLPILAIIRTKKDERWMEIGPNGLVTTIGSMRGEVPWTRIDYVADDGKRVLITGKNMNGFVIPVAAFANTEERIQLVQAMTAWAAAAGARGRAG